MPNYHLCNDLRTKLDHMELKNRIKKQKYIVISMFFI